MRYAKHGRNIRRVLYAPITLILLGALSVLLIRAAFKAYRDDMRTKENFSGIVQQAEDLRAREAFLTAEIEKLETERGIEEELRNKFPVAKEGESLVVIVEPETQTAGVYQSVTGSLWARIVKWFR